ncbi:type I polyketide synthase [Variovorax boronicumulans]|uniref:type I polyketide synthase n=1 Tax=Variovorax boronicumulans TaxID=436515 RepID=UPI00339B15D3
MTPAHHDLPVDPSLQGTLAIVGMAGRFPGAEDITTLWRHVCEGRDVRDTTAQGSGYLLQGIEDFAADFFEVPPRQARMLDPQHRVFLETVWHALENAGYVPDRCPGHVGIYAGSNFNNYMFHVADNFDLDAIETYLEAMIANDKDYLTSRVAHKLGFSGPAVTVSTSCSTSLVAIATACQSLLDFQCDMAIAGGAGLNVPQQRIYRDYKEGGMSRDGACHAFDADATGVVHGNGVGVLVLKRTEDALRDGDAIVALVRGFAVNNDGARKVGYSAPSVEGQAEVLAEALAMAGVDPASVGYIEAHGTGTPVGDPIEFAALSRVYGEQGAKRCALGSLKTHVGHLGAAAGVAGSIVAALALQRHTVPPMLHYTRPNPSIDLAGSPFEVLTQARDWPAQAQPRRAAVSSFGIGGTNAHLVLEEAPQLVPVQPATGTQLVALSARSREELDRMAQRLADHLEANAGASPADVAFTLAHGRKAFKHRRTVACDSVQDLVRQLRQSARVTPASETPPAIAFMYPGIGAQHAGMGEALYRQEAVYRDSIDRCAALLQPLLGRDIRSALQSDDATDLADPPFGLACVLAVEIALTELWRSRGVAPSCLIGHSLGEYAAAWASGVFTLPQVLGLVVLRGELIRRTAEGAMLVVSLDEAALRAMLPDGVSVAAVNAERLCMVSGSTQDIADFERMLGAAKIVTQRLGADRAAHSSLLDPVLDEFRAAVAAMPLQPPVVPFISNVTGTWITPAEATSADYWVRHLRETVRFADGVAVLLKEGRHALLELGPGRGLATLAKRHALARRDHCILASLHGGEKAGDDARAFTQALGALWCAGGPVEIARLVGDASARRIALPVYPFERQRYWLDRRAAVADASASLGKRSDIDSWFYVPSWRQAPAPASSAAAHGVEWLFGVAGEWFDALAASRRDEGHTVVRVEAADAWERVGRTHYRVRPANDEDHARLFEAALADHGTPARIVHAWAAAPQAATRAQDDVLASPAQQLGHASLLCLSRALAARGLTGSGLGIAVLSSQVFGVTGQERLVPEKATLLGPCRTWPYEFPQQGFVHIDLDETPQPGPWIDGLMRDIDGAAAQTGNLLSLAWRQGRRWRFGVEALSLPAPSTDTPVRDQGLYLITGAFGGIGSLAAQWLASTAKQPRLVLLSRSALPPRAQWAALLADESAEAALRARIRQVQALEALGAEIETVQADVADRTRMQAVRAQITARFGDAPFHGIVHAAGVPGGGLMQLEDSAADTRNLRAKVDGTRLLAELFDTPSLDFLMLCSSLGALAGTLGQAENTAANAFLDAFAQAGPLRAGVARSVNWDYWLEVGMILELAERHHRITGGEIETGIRPAEAPGCFERVLRAGLPQMVVSTADFPALLAARAKAAGQALAVFENADLRRDADAPGRPLDGPPYAPPTNAIERVLALLWQERLGIERIGIDDEFLALGGDSMLALPLMAEMREALQFDLPVRTLFAEQSIARITRHIVGNEAQPGLTERVAAVYLQVRGMSSEQLAAALNEEVTA